MATDTKTRDCLTILFSICLFIWKPGWPAKRDSPVSEISLCSYFYSKNYRAFIWTSGLARLPRSRLKEARSRLPGWKFLHINTHKRASPVAGMKVQRYRRKLFLTTVKSMSKQENWPGKRDEIFSYKHKRNSSLGNGRVSRVEGHRSRVIGRGSKVEVEGQKSRSRVKSRG